jgi:hypothetical protein
MLSSSLTVRDGAEGSGRTSKPLDLATAPEEGSRRRIENAVIIVIYVILLPGGDPQACHGEAERNDGWKKRTKQLDIISGFDYLHC